MVDTNNKSIRSRTSFDRINDRESNHIFFKEMSCYAHMEYGSTSLQGKMIILVASDSSSGIFLSRCVLVMIFRPLLSMVLSLNLRLIAN